MNLTRYDIRFPHPSSHLITGPSGCGKTFRTYEILKHKNVLFKGGSDIKSVIFCYAQWQKIYDKMKEENIVNKFVAKLPTVGEFEDLTKPHKEKGGSIVVFDDFMGQIGPDLDEIVRVTARHSNTTIIILFQSIFPPHKLARNISLNTKFVHVHKQPREAKQVSTFAYQTSSKNAKWMIQSFHKITEDSYTCALFDFTQECPEHLRLRSRYLPSEYPPLSWIAKGSLM